MINMVKVNIVLIYFQLHFIFRHRNPKNGTFEEKHWKRSTSVPKLEDTFKDKKPHLYTLSKQALLSFN